MTTIAVLKETKSYFVLRVPRKLIIRAGVEGKKFEEQKLLALSREAVKLHRQGKLPILHSLRDLR
jgi:hypothetical protein